MVEMLVVLVLSATLLTALMGITTILFGYQRTLTEKYPDIGWKNRLEEQIRHDVCNSREYKVNSDSLELVGYAGCDMSTGSSTLAASNIRYFIEEVAGTPWLIRRETHRQNTHVVSSTELVCRGVEAIQVERLEAARFLHRADQGTEMSMFARLPERMEVRLHEMQTEVQNRASDEVSPEAAQSNWHQDNVQSPWVFQVLLR